MKILVIDDEQAICSSVRFALEDDYEVFTATEAEDGLAIMKEQSIDGVLLDLRIGNDNGLELIPKLKEIRRDVVIIMMTAYGNIETSVRAMKEGAYQYLSKPLNLEELKLLIEKGLQFRRLNSVVHPQVGYAGIIGQSPKMQNLFELIRKVKDIDSNVLVMGESGTGKELVAKAIHYHGARKERPFSVINCAAIPENLLESELFGYEKGAFTGASTRKAGLFEQSHQGTIFLDEIGEMPLNLQAKILRVIQEREITPLGSAQRKEVDVRIISATNRDLYEEVQKGNFREDLYYRLNVIPVSLPPLRERAEDIPLMIEHFLEMYALRMNRKSLTLSHQAKDLLYRYSYPGNVRELSNILEYAVALADREMLDAKDLPAQFGVGRNERKGANGEEALEGIFFPSGLLLEEVEKRYILYTLEQCLDHRKRTADQLGISERGLRDKLKKYKEEDGAD
ncbi:sigma-54 dependent transcriptional regulator [Ammoniphilus sp. CFH 90114]|uniref:sigma-54-dependent transcriptional regulator n=1 Tax=Ammoniphilus sp. CFH 90114 TaxID=2493665 RepID=UPI00100FC3AF|nr:sigma-54 dependent transcriptional regulator [Ammoniphilus sp. CFH 90114]RXT09097.1 sigma-54-dependent Fis family transcriptional regulator [Ammoniphilus sp. CFH 90114]